MTKLVAILLTLIAIYIVKQGIKSIKYDNPPQYIAFVRSIGAAIFLAFFIIALFTTEETLYEFFSFLWE